MVRDLIDKLMDKDPRYKKYVLQREHEKAEKKRKIEEARAAQKAEKEEELRLYREERARQYAKAEEEAIARGDYETVIVEEWKCDICKKVFKKEAQLLNHLSSKKHK